MNYKKINDYELVYMVEEKNDDVFRLLCEKYHPLISKMALKYQEGARKRGYDYDDLYQLGLYGLYYAYTHYNEKRGVLFYSYVLLCMQAKVSNFFRASDTLAKKALNEAQFLDDNMLSYYENSVLEKEDVLGEQMLLNELITELIHFEHQLSFDRACIFELRMNDFAPNEISVLLDIPHKTVSNALYSIKRDLAFYLQRKGFKNV